MTIPPAVALPLYLLLAVFAAKRAISAVRDGEIAWGSYMSLVVSRRKHSGAFWFSVGILVFAALGLTAVSVRMAQALLAGA